MDEITIRGKGIFSIPDPGKVKTSNGVGGGFSEALSEAVNGVNHLNQVADKALLNIQTGRTENLHEAMIALEKADVAFRTLLTVRNKLLESYQEIMRMQV
jgi:flagellar hook-basal body complex protein FliE